MIESWYFKLEQFSYWWWPFIANHLWQSTLLLLFVYFLTFLLNKYSARAVVIVWQLAIMQTLIPTGLISKMALFKNTQQTNITKISLFTNTTIQNILLPFHQSSQIDEPKVGAYLLLTLIWILIGGILLGHLIWQNVQLALILRTAKLPSERETAQLVDACVALRYQPLVRLLVTNQPIEPGVWGLYKPIIMLPAQLSNSLSDVELKIMFIHELIHIRHKDNWLLIGQSVLARIFWFYPFFWIINQHLLSLREQACDEAVLQTGCDREAYALSILKVLRFCIGWNTNSITASFATTNLQRRINMIKNQKINIRANKTIVSICVVLLLCLTAFTINSQAKLAPQTAKQIKTWPPTNSNIFSLNFKQELDAPLIISNAEVAIGPLAQETGQFVLKPSFQVKNISNKPVTMFIARVSFRDNLMYQVFLKDKNITLSPQETFQALGTWYIGGPADPTNATIAQDCVLEILQVNFSDGTRWGDANRHDKKTVQQ